MNKLDKYLICLFSFVIAFVAIMIALFVRYQSTPDTLIISVFGLAGGECGVMGWIKSAKERKQDRRWKVEDRKKGYTDDNDTTTEGDDVPDDGPVG